MPMRLLASSARSLGRVLIRSSKISVGVVSVRVVPAEPLVRPVPDERSRAEQLVTKMKVVYLAKIPL